MAKKTKENKHSVPDSSKKVKKPSWMFLNSLDFIWDGHEWTVPSLGQHWYQNLQNRTYKFCFDLYEKYGLFRNNYTHDEVEGKLVEKYPHPPEDYVSQFYDECNIPPKVFHSEHEKYDYHILKSITNETESLLRSWLDKWIESESVINWNHIEHHERIINKLPEKQSTKIADNLDKQFRDLFV